MIYDYIVYLKNERGKYVNTISTLLCLISVTFFVYQQIQFGRKSLVLFIPIIIIIGGLVWNQYHVQKQNPLVSYSRILTFAGLFWFYMPFLQWLGVPLILLAMIEKHAKSPLEIGLTGDRIVFNSLIKREFPWNAFNNVMLKDGILTLDFKNNRLFQKETVDDNDDIIDQEFNDYCKKHLAGIAPEFS